MFCYNSYLFVFVICYYITNYISKHSSLNKYLISHSFYGSEIAKQLRQVVLVQGSLIRLSQDAHQEASLWVEDLLWFLAGLLAGDLCSFSNGPYQGLLEWQLATGFLRKSDPIEKTRGSHMPFVACIERIYLTTLLVLSTAHRKGELGSL